MSSQRRSVCTFLSFSPRHSCQFQSALFVFSSFVSRFPNPLELVSFKLKPKNQIIHNFVAGQHPNYTNLYNLSFFDAFLIPSQNVGYPTFFLSSRLFWRQVCPPSRFLGQLRRPAPSFQGQVFLQVRLLEGHLSVPELNPRGWPAILVLLHHRWLPHRPQPIRQLHR